MGKAIIYFFCLVTSSAFQSGFLEASTTHNSSVGPCGQLSAQVASGLEAQDLNLKLREERKRLLKRSFGLPYVLGTALPQLDSIYVDEHKSGEAGVLDGPEEVEIWEDVRKGFQDFGGVSFNVASLAASSAQLHANLGFLGRINFIQKALEQIGEAGFYRELAMLSSPENSSSEYFEHYGFFLNPYLQPDGPNVILKSRIAELGGSDSAAMMSLRREMRAAILDVEKRLAEEIFQFAEEGGRLDRLERLLLLNYFDLSQLRNSEGRTLLSVVSNESVRQLIEAYIDLQVEIPAQRLNAIEGL